ncbi:MAG: DNA helicase RecG, partial [Clostridia bacterium]|nr:DNA helicase RecG [Clostridia bacterium]
ERLDGFIQKTVTEGGRAYVVCPMIEDNEEYDIQSAQSRYKQLCEYLGDDKVGLVHGKLKPSQKDAVMTAFANGEISVLVSTTVIEVGVNVPEATLMVIENAERFGLSQLHQLRGRVGRGSKKSYCILISDSQTESTQERLEYFTKTTDGFKISEKDLELRGPGDFFGERQHGLPELKIASLTENMDIVRETAEASEAILKDDPMLKKEENLGLRLAVRRLFYDKNKHISLN